MKNKSFMYIGVLMLISVLFFVCYYTIKPKGSIVYVQMGKKVYGTYDLNKDQTIKIDLGAGEYNLLQIKDKKADMIESTCENQICVHDYPLEEGESRVIVCLPHEVIIEIREN